MNNFTRYQSHRLKPQFLEHVTIVIGHDETPRYRVVSPVMRGSYTESVRELNELQVASLKSRGYRIDQVSSNVALRKSINISAKIKPLHTTPPISKRARRGFIGDSYDVKIKRVSANVIPKSTYSPRKIFREDWGMFHERTRWGIDLSSRLRIYYFPARRKYYKLKVSTAATLNKRGWNLKLQPQLTEIPSKKKPTPTSYPTTYKDETQRDQNTERELQRMRAELENSKRQLEEMNKRMSEQLVELGSATVDRSGETQANANKIQESMNWIKEVNDRVSKQLIELGNAVSEQSKQIALAKADQVVKQVQQGVGGIGGFFKDNQMMITIGLIVVMMVMMKR